MRRSFMTVMLLTAALGMSFVGSASAGEAAGEGVRKAKTHQARKGTRVKGFVARSGGGYSYNYADTVNTYGDSRGRFGSASSFRDSGFGRQTNGGPFDHGFFFDSGIGTPHGGDSPYMH